ncbi:MAG: hypothetical protein MJ214_01530 [Bacilli bacterium]|nr:hypothetical protein [Bacilli bacterium]
MKKIITLSNCMVLLGIMTILFYLIPAVTISLTATATYSTTTNLFVATFGGGFTVTAAGFPIDGSFAANGGLVTAFILGIVAILLTLLKNKNKYATLLACPFYIASGVLVACTSQLVDHTTSNPVIFHCATAGGAITVAVFWCLLGFFALIDFIAAVAKPKQVNPAY